MTRIKRMLELISSNSFNLHYMKGKDMILSNFLSRQKNDNSNPHEIIPISFSMCKIPDDNYYNIEKHLIKTRSHARSCGVKLPEVHDMGKNLDPDQKPRKATCHFQRRKHGKATHRSRKSWNKKKET